MRFGPCKKVGGEHINAFADIFKTNATKNGLLVIELAEEEVDIIFEHVRANEGLQATVDLLEQTVEIHTTSRIVFSFSIEEGDKHQLLNGHDDIDLTLKYESDITRFEETHDPFMN
jgi:3-isopropylmalate/(R)-2-methylmalate dehydratase small subunit